MSLHFLSFNKCIIIPQVSFIIHTRRFANKRIKREMTKQQIQSRNQSKNVRILSMKTFKGRTAKFPNRAWKLSSFCTRFLARLFVASGLMFPLAAWKMDCLAAVSSMRNLSTMTQSVALVGTERLKALLKPSAMLFVR